MAVNMVRKIGLVDLQPPPRLSGAFLRARPSVANQICRTQNRRQAGKGWLEGLPYQRGDRLMEADN